MTQVGKFWVGEAANGLPVMVIVGDVSGWRAAGRLLPELPAIHYADVFEVDSHMLRTLAPDIVLSPLVTAKFDALELAVRLHGLGFKGRYRAVTSPLPRPDLVLREVRARAPGLDFNFLLPTELGLDD